MRRQARNIGLAITLTQKPTTNLAYKTRILDCGGKRSATPLSRSRGVMEHPKTSRPLESGVAAPALPPQQDAFVNVENLRQPPYAASENSPAIYCWVYNRQKFKVPSGTTENPFDNTNKSTYSHFH
jgi:hypothetical protein